MEDLLASVKAVAASGPLVQCVTNYVSMDIMANVLLAIGASPAESIGAGTQRPFSPLLSSRWELCGESHPESARYAHPEEPANEPPRPVLPQMVHSADEAGEFAAIAGAVSINIGTLSRPWIDGMHKAIDACEAHAKPWVLDPARS